MHRSSPLIEGTGSWLTNMSQEFCITWAKDRSWETTCDGGSVPPVMQGQLHIPTITKAIDVIVIGQLAPACDSVCGCKRPILCNTAIVQQTPAFRNYAPIEIKGWKYIYWPGSNDTKVSNFLYDTSDNSLPDNRIAKSTVELKYTIT
jgi:hypothetical protein